MRRVLLYLSQVLKNILLLLSQLAWPLWAADTATQVILAVHGGTADHKKIPLAEEASFRSGLEAALKAGYAVLKAKGSSLDAVEAAVILLENNPLFNAGKGAVFTKEGKNELEAAIMDGKTHKAGAVTGVTAVKNPISAARAVMDRTPHVFLAGDAVEKLAKEVGLALVDASYFSTPRRRDELMRVQQRQQLEEGKLDGTKGTVGAVALDEAGNFAVATSTGGRVNKMHGRVGDTPIIGASTYAENGLCAISTTGHGEFFIRLVVAYDICARVKYLNWPLAQAADEVVQKKLKPMGGNGGIIAIDSKGNLAMSRNTEGMPRGYVTRDGKIHVFLFGK